MGGLFDSLLKSPEKRETDILTEVETSIAMGERKKARSLLRKFVEFEKALGKATVQAGVGVAKKMGEMETTPTQPQAMVSPTVLQVRPSPPTQQLDNVINRLERLKDTI